VPLRRVAPALNRILAQARRRSHYNNNHPPTTCPPPTQKASPGPVRPLSRTLESGTLLRIPPPSGPRSRRSACAPSTPGRSRPQRSRRSRSSTSRSSSACSRPSSGARRTRRTARSVGDSDTALLTFHEFSWLLQLSRSSAPTLLLPNCRRLLVPMDLQVPAVAPRNPLYPTAPR
jgi:hypothetical protein